MFWVSDTRKGPVSLRFPYESRRGAVSPALPEAFQFQMLPSSVSPFKGPTDMLRVQELTLLTPFMLWMQAAEMWQRNWAEAMTGSYEPRQERPNRKAAN